MNSLVKAVKEGQNIEEIRPLIDGLVDVNLEYKEKSPLYLAAENGRTEVVKLLLERGATVDKLNEEGRFTALYIASQRGHTEVVKALLDKGAAVDGLNEGGQFTALCVASQFGRIEVVKELLDRGAEIDKLNYRGNSTALYLASEFNRIEAVKELLDRGAEIDKLNDNKKFTALFISASKGHTEIVKLLLDRGAEIDKLNDNKKFTALFISAYKGYTEIVKLLLDRGAEIDKLNDNEYTALYIASRFRRTEIVKLLLNRGADVNIEIDGKSILELAKKKIFLNAINDLIISHISAPSVPYKGVSRPDIEVYNIFLAIPDYPQNPTEEQKKKAEEDAIDNANNTSLCPVCLEPALRSMGCLYMHHTCKRGVRHPILYNKYKDDRGDIWWCTDCGRICNSHYHYKLGPAEGDVPELHPGGDPFSKTCISQGGGSVTEKLKRISRLIDYYAELQTAISSGETFPDSTTIRNKLIEQAWNGALIETFVNPQSVKRWKTSLDIFPGAEKPAEQSPLVVPAGSFENPILIPDYEDPISLGVCTAVQFNHKNKDGVLFSHVYATGEQKFICKPELIQYLTTGGEFLGKCYDTECGGYLWPPEVRQAFALFEGGISAEEETLLKKYEDRFPRMTGGGRLPDLNTYFTWIDNGKCYVKAGKRRTYKKKLVKSRIRTRLNRA